MPTWFIRYFSIGYFIGVVSMECKLRNDNLCSSQKNIKACLCTCLDLQIHRQKYLKIHTKYRCTDILKDCNQSLSLRYSVIDANDLSEEEIYVSRKIKVPYDKEIFVELQKVQPETSYNIYMKTFCFVCGEDCMERLLQIPGTGLRMLQTDKETESAALPKGTFTIAISSVVLLLWLSIGLVLVILLNARGKRQFEQLLRNINQS